MDQAFFQQQYEADAANKGKQGWKDYQDWVRTFYEGKTFPPVPGWKSREKDILSKMPSARQGEVSAALAKAGQLLAAEWAKDNSVRRVSTSDLQTWGRRFSDAAKDPDALLKALREVEAEVSARRAK